MSHKIGRVFSSFHWSPLFLVFLLAFVPRILGVLFTTITGANPFAQADSLTFASHAERTAHAVRTNGPSALLDVNISNTNKRIGAMWSVFWLLPGYSHLYARLASGFIGSVAILFVYLIAKRYFSDRAGIYAILPIALFPSFILVHSTVLRESVLLFCVTGAAYFFVTLKQSRRPWALISPALGLLFVAGILRNFMFPVFGATAVLVAAVYAIQSLSLRGKVAGLLGSFLSIGFLSVVTQKYIGVTLTDAPSYYARRRARLARGRTAYLVDVIPSSFFDTLLYGPILTAYFLFAPFPWMIDDQITDIMPMVEGILTVILLVGAVYGVRYSLHKRPSYTIMLVSGFVIGAVGFGLGVANYGHAARLRHGFTWVIYLYAGIYLSQRFVFKL